MPRLPAVSGRILIVDDDERQRTALAAMLSDCDFETQVAGDGQEASTSSTSFSTKTTAIRSWASVPPRPARIEGDPPTARRFGPDTHRRRRRVSGPKRRA